MAILLSAALLSLPTLLDGGSGSTLALPPALLEAAKRTAESAQGITLLLAFLAGALSILSPCVLPFLPAFFAYLFKDKTRIFFASFAFFAGFATIFVSVGLLLVKAGNSFFTTFQDTPEWQGVILVAGLLLVALGAMAALGVGFSGARVSGLKPSADLKGAFLFGALFAVGWTACMGPVLSGIIIIAGLGGQELYAAGLLLAYSFGLFVPLFALSYFSDSLRLHEHPLFSKPVASINLLGKRFELFFANLAAGLIVAVIGVLFVVFRGTSWVLELNAGNSMLFESLQRQLLSQKQFGELVAVCLLAAIAIAVFFYAKGLKKSEKQKGLLEF